MVDLASLAPNEITPPEYLRYSHPSEQPMADTGLGQLLKTVGEGIGEGSKAAVDLAKENAINVTRERGDALMDEAVATFEPTYKKLNNIPDNVTPDPADVKNALQQRLANPDANANANQPDALKNGIARATDLSNMSNKANNTFDATYFQGRVRDALKSLRARFPGFRDDVDRAMQETTGEAGANDYWRGMISNINSYITKADALKKQQDTHIWGLVNNGSLTPDDYGLYVQGKLSFDQAIINAGRNSWAKAADERAKTARTHTQDTDEDSLNRNLHNQSTQMMSNLAANTGSGNVADLLKQLNDIADGKTQVDQPTRERLLGQLDQAINTARIQMFKVSGGMAPSGQPYGASVDPTKVNTMIDAHLHNLQAFADAMRTNNMGVAKGLVTIMQAQQTNEDWMFHNSQPGQMATMVAAANKVSPEAGKAVLESLTSHHAWNPKFDAYVMDRMNQMLAQPDPNHPYTAKDALDDIRDKIKQAGGNPEDPKNAQMMEQITRMAEVFKYARTTEAQKNIIESLFNPKNAGIVGYFANNSLQYNGTGGVSVRPGQYDIFRRLIDPDLVKESHKIGGETWQHTVDFAENTFGHQLLPQALKDFGNIKLNTDERLAWDNEHHQFFIQKNIGGYWTGGLDDYTKDPGRPRYNERFVNQPGSAISGRAFPGFTDPHTRFTLGLINRGIQTMEPVAKYQNKDMNQYVYDLLAANGVDLHNVNSPGGAMAASIRAAADAALREKQEQEERRNETINKSGSPGPLRGIAPPKVRDNPNPSEEYPPQLNQQGLLDYAKRHPELFNAGPQ